MIFCPLKFASVVLIMAVGQSLAWSRTINCGPVQKNCIFDVDLESIFSFFYKENKNRANWKRKAGRGRGCLKPN
jgi:hypothetical protein